jgi:hypothetical protein
MIGTGCNTKGRTHSRGMAYYCVGEYDAAVRRAALARMEWISIV